MGAIYNPFSLEGKIILVTGASSGIGKATAIECSKMGARVIITGRNEERLNETYKCLEGEGHCQIIAELTKSEDVENLVSKVGKLNGVVLCAGKGLTLPLLYSTPEKFSEIFNINFFSPVELLRLLVKKKCVEKESSVVFIDSIGGVRRWSHGNAIYGSSKAALSSVIHFYAIELGVKKIRVNGICPGMVETPLISSGTITEEQMQADRDKYPLKRYGRPIDIADGVVYLLSNASSWVTGHCLVIDGGITAK